MIRSMIDWLSVWRIVAPAVAVAAFSQASASGATIGYWRFEGNDTEFLQDSSGNGRHITAGTVANNAPANQAVIPGVGNGSAFPNPVPQNALANNRMLSVANATGAVLNNAVFLPNATGFTIEAFVNTTTTMGNAFAASVRGDTGQFGWSFGRTSNQLSLQLSSNGTSETSVLVPNSTFAFLPNTDYYVAASWDNLGAADTVTFYFQDLTNGGLLQSYSNASVAFGDLHASTANFAIAGQGVITSNRWNGLLDEIRLSEGILGVNDLLINQMSITPDPGSVPVPEPASLLLVGLGLLLPAARRRKQAGAHVAH